MNVPTSIRVLLVEDSQTDAELVERELGQSGIDCRTQRVDTAAQLEQALASFSPQVVLSDFAMPSFDGLAALARCRAADPDLPFIFVSGTMGEHVAVDAMKAGASDYVMKGNLARLAPAMQRELREAEGRRARRREQEQLAAMARRLVTLQEKERGDIARELHDRVGQNLSALGVNLERLHGEQAGRAAQQRIAECISLVEATALLIQDVLTELKPPMLAGYGLLDALRWHARDFSRRAGISVEVEGAQAERLAPEIEMALFRIAQGALANVAQHARARNVRIAVADKRFEVGDDGVGFDVERALARGRWGLSTMRERAEAIGAALRIESEPGKGSRVIVEIEG